MNWTASLLRNQLNKQKLAHQEKLSLLANNYQQWEQELITDLQKDLGIDFCLNYQDVVTQLAGRTMEQFIQEKETIITNQQEKITRLETILNKDKEDKGNQTIINYEAILKNKERKIKELREEKKELMKLVKASQPPIPKATESLETSDNSPLSHKDRRKLRQQGK